MQKNLPEKSTVSFGEYKIIYATLSSQAEYAVLLTAF
jgi:hypothetical protein